MIRTYTLAIEGDGGSYSAYVPELPTILVTGDSPEEVTSRAKEAISLYWEELRADRPSDVILQEIEIELPA